MSDPTVPPGPPPSSPPPPPSGPTGPGAPPPPGPTGPGAPPPPSSPPPPSTPGGGGGGYTPPPTGTESPNRGLMIILSYLGPLALIPLLVEKEDREVQWHAKHGLVLFGLWVVVGIVLSILTSLIAFLDLGCTGCLLHSLLGLVILAVHVTAIVKGLNGQRLILPGISQYADRF